MTTTLTIRYTVRGQTTEVAIEGQNTIYPGDILGIVQIFAKNLPALPQSVDFTHLNGEAGEVSAAGILAVTPGVTGDQNSVLVFTDGTRAACQETAAVLIQRWETAKARSAVGGS